MKWLVRPLMYVWTFWCLIVTGIALIIAFIIMWLAVNLGGDGVKERLYFVPYWFGKSLLFLFGVRLNIKGQEKVDYSKQYIFSFNHTSNLDPLISATMSKHGKFLGKAEILSYPIIGYALKHLYISVRRNDKDDRDRSLRDLRIAVEKGASPVIYPEGTRNRGPHILGEFKRGAFKISQETGVPIVVCTTINSWDLMRGDEWVLKPGVVHGFWDGPFMPEDFDSMESMREHIKSVMEQHMLKNYPNGVLE